MWVPKAREGGETTIVPLWVSAFAFAHLFSGYWLVKSMLVTNPQLSLRRLFCCCFLRAPVERLPAVQPEGGSGTPGEDLDELAHPKGRLAELQASELDGHRVSSGSTQPSVAEVDRIELEWQALSCWYSTNTGNKWVLKDVYGSARPSEMQALMGPSGAGKSTLMDILAQRKSTGHLGGVVLVDGLPADAAFIRRTAYVPQFDNFVPVMTTLETLQFYAGIILPSRCLASRRAARVDEVLREMGLAAAAKTLVGGQVPGGLFHRGLSGGERKRLSIAAGVLAAPSVVFLDEPTTGLDSFAALTVMGYLRRMARDNGHIVIACIHQPRAAIWSMFDSVTLLSCGRLMYTGTCDGLPDWFASLGFDYNAGLHGTVPDWALDLVACGSHKPRAYFGTTISSRREVRTLSAHFVAQWLGVHSSCRLATGETDDSSILHRARGGGWGGGGGGGGGGGLPPLIRAHHGGRGLDGGGGGSKEKLLAGGMGLSGPLGSGGSSSGSSGIGAYGGAGGGAGGWGAQQQQQQQQPPRSPRRPCSPSRATLCDRAAASLPSCAMDEERAALLRPAGWLQQYRWVLYREYITITRNPAEVAGRTLTNSWVAATMGLLYYSIPNDSTSLRAKINMLLNMLAFFCLMPYISMSLYTAGKATYLADVSAKLYSPSAYYLAKVTATLPFQLVSCLTFTFVLYGMAGLRNSVEAIWAQGAITSCMALIAVQVMHFCAVVAPTQDVAFMYSIAWTCVQLLFNNFFITFKEVTLQWLTHLKYLSAVYYAYEGMAVVEFEGISLPCSRGLDPAGAAFLRELLPNTKLLKLKAVQNAISHPGADCVADAGAVLEYFQFGRGFKLTLGILGGYWLVTHVATYAAMLVVARRERR